MAITLEQIKELRNKTGAGINVVKEALEQTNGDMEKAVVYLREKGLAKAAKRAENSVSNGYIATYVHGEGNMVVALELNCETDFSARNETFKKLAYELAIHVAAMNPSYISIEGIPADLLAAEKEIHLKTIDGNKPENVKEMILQGKLAKWYEELVLLEQKYIKDEGKTVKDLLNEAVAAIGEKIVIGSFVIVKIGNSPVAVTSR